MARSHFRPHDALVTRASPYGDFTYLKLSAEGAVTWTQDPQEAEVFEDMREATRMAFRLPAACKAFGMPAEVEADAFRTLH